MSLMGWLGLLASEWKKLQEDKSHKERVALQNKWGKILDNKLE